MAVFDIAEQYITDDVGRPEMSEVDANGSSIVRRRIQRAVLAMHRIDFWQKDFVEQKYAFQYNQAVQVINLASFPRIRSIGYIRKFNSSLASNADVSIFGQAGDMFKEINPQQVFDGYSYDRRNSMYRSGSTIKINSSESIQELLVGWFIDPLLDPIAVCDSWILTDYPSLIAAAAKRRIFKDIGKDEESRAAEQEFQDELLKLQINNTRLAVLQQ